MKERLHTYYKNKKVFLTGHTGFKGTWLTAMLRYLGATVKGYSLAPTASKPFHELFSFEGMERIEADIRDKERLKDAIVSFQPDYIYHLAAQPLVIRSYQIPAETFDVNVTGTANLLEALHALVTPCTCVIITTDKVYLNKEDGTLYKEGDRLGGFDPYSASKACTELVVSSFRDSFFQFENSAIPKGLASARAGNVIGGGDWSENRIIPDIIRSLMGDRPVSIRNPRSVRPWQHVLEPLGGYLLLGTHLNDDPARYSTAYNFGPHMEDHLTVKELADLALACWGSGNLDFGSAGNGVHEAQLLKLDISKSRQELNWEPKLDATSAIDWTIQWYRQPDGKKEQFTYDQIISYLAIK